MRKLLAVAVLALAGCNALLGLDFEPRTREDATDGAGGVPSEEDGGTTAPDAATDARVEVKSDGGIDDEQARLAALRTRLASSTRLDGFFTSKSWLYYETLTGMWSGRQLPGTETRTLPFMLNDGNDTHVVTGRTIDPATIRLADTGMQIATFARDSTSFAVLDDGIVFFPEVTSGTDVVVWRATEPTARPKIGNIPSQSLLVLGRSSTSVFLRNFLDATQLIVVDAGAAPGITKLTKSVEPQSVVETTDGLVLAHVGGSEVLFQLLPRSGPTVDLTAGIAAADCIIPPSERGALSSSTTVLGGWLFYAGRGGILAYRHADKRLVPVQIRKPTDRFLFNVPKVVRATRTLVFQMPDPEGLYAVPLDAILPP